MAQPDLRQKFPSMTPISGPPALFRVNGCGVGVYGKRDADAETNTYIATWCLSLVFIPCFCLKAYRVAKAPRGWYFIGREPLSLFAKAWNIAVVTAIITAVGVARYDTYISSPAYKAKQQIAEARSLVEQGKLAEAARIYERQAVSHTPEADNAIQAMKDLIDGACQQAPLSEVAEVFASAVTVAHLDRGFSPAELVEKGMKLASGRGQTDPRAGAAILDVIRPLTIDTRKIDNERMALLRKWAEAEPKNIEVVAPLASMLEQQGKLPEAKKLLMPVKDKLGDGEGARALGLILAHEGDLDGAYSYLWPYVKPRLDKLHSAEQAAEDAGKQLWDREINALRNNQGPPEFYADYKRADKDRQQAMVREFVNGQIKDDPLYTSSQEALTRELPVVPVALDLGVILLQRAQAEHDGTKRREQLKSAEEVFLAIGGVAGQTDAYRLSLAQIDYWLGKQAEGRKLFDDYLAAKQRAFTDLIGVAARLRQLGSEPEARALAEEAYNKTADSQEQHEAAELRAACQKDIDDEIEWLKKCNTADASIRGRLATAVGWKDFREGRDDEAVAQFQSAVDAYAGMPKTATTLNQLALAYHAMFQANGDRQVLDRCVDSFQQAVDLSPSDPILIYNAGIALLGAGYSDVIGGEIDLRALHRLGDRSLLDYLYNDAAGRETIARRVKEHPALARALAYLDKSMLLSPKRPGPYEAAFSLHQFTHDEPALISLEERMKAAGLDTADELENFKEYRAGTKDEQNKLALSAALKRNEDLVGKLRGQGGLTLAVALVDQAENMFRLDSYGSVVDASQVMKLVEEAHRAAPSSFTRRALMTAHLFAASKSLRQSTPNFETFCKKFDRSMSVVYLMAVVLGEKGSFQQEALAHPDVKAAVELAKGEIKAFPDSISEVNWAILKGADPAAADKAAEVIRRTPRQLVGASIDMLMHPFSPAAALERYWLMQIHGKQDEARDAIRKLIQQGIAMPIEP